MVNKLVILMSIFSTICGSTDPAIAQNIDCKYALVIHGGAGSATADIEVIAARELVLGVALDKGSTVLSNGGTSLDAVEEVIRILEDSPLFNAGKGAVLTATSTNEHDATIMDGSTRACGAVGGVTTVKNPISLARLVMTDTRHVLLAAHGADEFAANLTHPNIEIVPPKYFRTQGHTKSTNTPPNRLFVVVRSASPPHAKVGHHVPNAAQTHTCMAPSTSSRKPPALAELGDDNHSPSNVANVVWNGTGARAPPRRTRGKTPTTSIPAQNKYD